MIAKEMEKTLVPGLHLQTKVNHGIRDREKCPFHVYRKDSLALATFSDITRF
jgi:hypothetical protein